MPVPIRLRTLVAGAAISTALCGPAFAQAAPENTVTANVGIFSNYIFRGISQTAGKPAVQGGLDWAHASGFYAGTWGSNISWLEDWGLYSRSSLEWDFYGGFKQNFPNSDFWYDLGTIYYYYPGSKNSTVFNVPGGSPVYNADTWELYAGLGWKWIGLKFSYNLDDYFGTRPTGQKTDGTWYLDLSATYPIGDSGFALIGHYGYLDVAHDGSGPTEASYQDWKVGASYTVPEGVLKGLEIGAYYSGNNAESAFYTDPTGYNTGKDVGVVYVKKTF